MNPAHALGVLLFTILPTQAVVTLKPMPGRYVGVAVIQQEVGTRGMIRFKETRRVEAVFDTDGGVFAIAGPNIFENGNVFVGGFGEIEGKRVGRFNEINYEADWTRRTVRVKIVAPE